MIHLDPGMFNAYVTPWEYKGAKCYQAIDGKTKKKLEAYVIFKDGIRFVLPATTIPELCANLDQILTPVPILEAPKNASIPDVTIIKETDNPNEL